MTDPAAFPPPYAPPSTQPAAYPPRAGGRRRRASRLDRWAPGEDVRAAVKVVAVLAVLGAVLGVFWQWWSPPGPRGYVIQPGAIQPEETESFVAGDGRFAILAMAVGLIAAIVVWRRKSTRGPAALAALGIGGLLGAVLMAAVGHWLAGGAASGKANTVIAELPLTVHMRGLLMLEAAVAVLVYSVFVSFAVEDDLGRPDPYRPQPRETLPQHREVASPPTYWGTSGQ